MALTQRQRHVRLLHETEMEADAEEPFAVGLNLKATDCANARTVLGNHGQQYHLSWSTWLCSRLCNNACGTASARAVRKTAVPCTRWGGCERTLAINKGKGSAVSSSRSTMTPPNRAKGHLQIIDHAGSEVWDGIEGVSQAEEWLGDKLLPPRFEA